MAVVVDTLRPGFRVALVVKNLRAIVGGVRDMGSIPGSRLLTCLESWERRLFTLFLRGSFSIILNRIVCRTQSIVIFAERVR